MDSRPGGGCQAVIQVASEYYRDDALGAVNLSFTSTRRPGEFKERKMAEPITLEVFSDYV